MNIEAISGYVYCAMDEQRGVCKIGMSTSETNRVKSLATGYPGKLISEVVKVKDRREAENYLHRLFHDRRVQGEWFEGVAFKEFFGALHEYQTKKLKQYLNSLEFYKFLYSTPFELANGISEKAQSKLNRLHARVFLFIGYGFNDDQLLRDKYNNALKNLLAENALITIVYPEYNLPKNRLFGRGSYGIEHEWFFPNYNYVTGKQNNCYLENCLSRIDTCYAALFFCVKEHSKITIMKNRCMSRGIKYKVIESKLKTKYKTSKKSKP